MPPKKTSSFKEQYGFNPSVEINEGVTVPFDVDYPDDSELMINKLTALPPVPSFAGLIRDDKTMTDAEFQHATDDTVNQYTAKLEVRQRHVGVPQTTALVPYDKNFLQKQHERSDVAMNDLYNNQSAVLSQGEDQKRLEALDRGLIDAFYSNASYFVNMPECQANPLGSCLYASPTNPIVKTAGRDYPSIQLGGRTYDVHKMIAAAKHPERNVKYYKNTGKYEPTIPLHLCGNKHCFNPNHIVYSTEGHNQYDNTLEGRRTRQGVKTTTGFPLTYTPDQKKSMAEWYHHHKTTQAGFGHYHGAMVFGMSRQTFEREVNTPYLRKNPTFTATLDPNNKSVYGANLPPFVVQPTDIEIKRGSGTRIVNAFGNDYSTMIGNQSLYDSNYQTFLSDYTLASSAPPVSTKPVIKLRPKPTAKMASKASVALVSSLRP